MPIGKLEELDSFLKDYERAANSRNFNRVAPFISDDAVFWFTNGAFTGKEAIRHAFENTWTEIKDETYTISDTEWKAASDTVAICIYTFTSDGVVGGRHQVYRGRGTNVLHILDGKWQIVHEHLSKA